MLPLIAGAGRVKVDKPLDIRGRRPALQVIAQMSREGRAIGVKEHITRYGIRVVVVTV